MLIHRYWTGPEQPPHEPWLGAVVRSMAGTHEVVDWTDDTLPPAVSMLVDSCTAQVAPRYALKHRSNLVRLALLTREGGVWLDHDVIPLVRLDQLEPPWIAATGSTPCSCAMAFPMLHPMLRRVLSAALDAPGSPHATSMFVSGEQLIARHLTRDVQLVRLPFDASGAALRLDAPAALVHTWATGAQGWFDQASRSR